MARTKPLSGFDLQSSFQILTRLKEMSLACDQAPISSHPFELNCSVSFRYPFRRRPRSTMWFVSESCSSCVPFCLSLHVYKDL